MQITFSRHTLGSNTRLVASDALRFHSRDIIGGSLMSQCQAAELKEVLSRLSETSARTNQLKTEDLPGEIKTLLAPRE